MVQSIEESSSLGAEDSQQGGGQETSEETSTSSSAPVEASSLGAVPKRRSPRFKQKPAVDRLRSGSRSAKQVEVPSRPVSNNVVRTMRTSMEGKEIWDIVKHVWLMDLSPVLEALFGFLSPADLCRVVQVRVRAFPFKLIFF